MRELNENGVNLTRQKGNKEPKSKYFIIPEGDKTEVIYFQGIKQNSEDLNINSLIEIRIIGNEEEEKGESHPLRKLANFEDSVKQDKIIYSNEIDKVYFVIDRDPQNFKSNQLEKFIEKCRNNGYHICLSNPTFELFLLMHDDRILALSRTELLENRKTRKGGKRFLEKKLSEFFGCNKTNLIFENFKDKIAIAIKNEHCFCENLEELKTKLGSNVGRLLANLIDCKST